MENKEILETEIENLDTKKSKKIEKIETKFDFKCNLNLKYPLFINGISIPFSNKDFGLEISKEGQNEEEIKLEIEKLNDRIMKYFVEDLSKKTKTIGEFNFLTSENFAKFYDRLEEKSVDFMEIDGKKITLKNLENIVKDLEDFKTRIDKIEIEGEIFEEDDVKFLLESKKEMEEKMKELEINQGKSRDIFREFIKEFGDPAKEILKKYK